MEDCAYTGLFFNVAAEMTFSNNYRTRDVHIVLLPLETLHYLYVQAL